MSSYCLKFKKYIERIIPKVSKANDDKTMILPKCVVCVSKKSRFIKKEEANGILSNLGLTTPLSKIPLLDNILFEMKFY